jgi:hypothetical protein
MISHTAMPRRLVRLKNCASSRDSSTPKSASLFDVFRRGQAVFGPCKTKPEEAPTRNTSAPIGKVWLINFTWLFKEC